MVLTILLIIYSKGHQCNDHPEQESKEREQAPWKKEDKLRFPTDKPGNALKQSWPGESACHLTHSWNQLDPGSDSRAWANHNFSMTQ